MKLLLHTCCAPCALPILDYFKSNGNISNITLFFFNPNIYEEEYIKRLEYVKKVGEHYGASVIEGKNDHDVWLDYLKNNLDNDLKSYLENELRCQFCFKFRLEESIMYAKNNGFDGFCSTLQTNLYKDTEFIIDEAKKLCEKYGLEFVELSLDKKIAYEKGKELCKELDIYRQKFCGCEFSKSVVQ